MQSMSAGIILAAVVNNVKASVTQCTPQFIPDSHIRLMCYVQGEGSFSSGGESIVYCLGLPADSRSEREGGEHRCVLITLASKMTPITSTRFTGKK